jgi:hypothetical protein
MRKDSSRAQRAKHNEKGREERKKERKERREGGKEGGKGSNEGSKSIGGMKKESDQDPPHNSSHLSIQSPVFLG